MSDDKIYVVCVVVFLGLILSTCFIEPSGSHPECQQWEGRQHLSCMGGKG
jgi:hypothetical protein